MISKKTLFLCFVIAIFSVTTNAQKKTVGAASTGTSSTMYEVPSLQSRINNLIPSDNSPRVIKDKRHFSNQVVIGKDKQVTNDYFTLNRNPLEQSVQVGPPELVIDAVDTFGSPSDPDIGVGPNHLFVVYNTGFRIFDKQGNALTEELDPSNIFTERDVCCDLTVSYDNAADRWVVSVLAATLAGNSGSHVQIAVSKGPDPINDGWNSYLFNMDTDYQKLSVWSDGYYMTANKFSGEIIHAFDRSAMIAGNSSADIQGFNLPGIVDFGFFSPQALNVVDDNSPAAGGATFVYMQDDSWSGVSSDHLKVWTLDVDWNNPSNSNIELQPEIPLTPFIGTFDGGSFENLPQPNGGVKIDALQNTIMNQAQFRKFATHNSAVFNFVVDTDAGNNKVAGIRWIELRQSGDNQPWSLYQEGTYTSPDGKHAWNGGISINSEGSIGLAYSSLSGPNSTSDMFVSLFFTGRVASDPLGTMSVSEELISQGTGNIGGTRYGDYAKLDVDPSDGKTFWNINEHVKSRAKAIVSAFKIENALSVEDPEITNATFSVIAIEENKYDIKFTTSYNGRAEIGIYDFSGRLLSHNFLKKEGDSFNYKLDMSYAAKGVYLVKMGNSKSSKVKKITVK